MLNVLAKEDFEKCIGFAYDLALDPTITSYPVYYDGVKTREDFIRRAEEAFHNQNEEILLFSDEDSALGWIHYYYLPEDNYLGTVSLSIRKNKETAMDEFLLYVEQKYPGCHIYLGFPEENQEAISALIHHDFRFRNNCGIMCLIYHITLETGSVKILSGLAGKITVCFLIFTQNMKLVCTGTMREF